MARGRISPTAAGSGENGWVSQEGEVLLLLETLKTRILLGEHSHSDTVLANLERPLVELLSISRSSDGRARLAELRTIPSLLVLLEDLHKTFQQSHGYPESSSSSVKVLDILLLVLKFIRNLCAGDSTNQDAFLESGGVAVLSPITTTLLSASRQVHQAEDSVGSLSNDPSEKDSMLERMKARFGSMSVSSPGTAESGPISASRPVNCLQMMVQLLGNFSRRGEASEAAVWEGFFPNFLLELAALRIKEICEPLSMVLYVCCQNNGDRCWQLSQGDGAALMALLIVSTVDNDLDTAPGNMFSSKEKIEWFELLVQQLCLQDLLFPLLFTNLGVPPLTREVELLKVDTDELLSVCQLCLETSSPTSLQASLLYILCDCLMYQNTNSQELNVGGDKHDESGLKLPMPLKSMCFMVDILRCAARCAAKDSEFSSVPTSISGSPSVQVLGFVLSLLRVLSAWDDNNGDRKKPMTSLVSYGLIDLLLDLLEALGPPEAPHKGPNCELLLEDKTLLGVGTCPRKNPYQGYRRDIVAVIANCSHQTFCVQERVREKGGLILVLQQCMVDKENPFLREWGLWAMRNLLEGNDKNQAEIADLEVKEMVNLPELGKMGLNVEIDPNTKRPHLVNNASTSQP